MTEKKSSLLKVANESKSSALQSNTITPTATTASRLSSFVKKQDQHSAEEPTEEIRQSKLSTAIAKQSACEEDYGDEGFSEEESTSPSKLASVLKNMGNKTSVSEPVTNLSSFAKNYNADNQSASSSLAQFAQENRNQDKSSSRLVGIAKQNSSKLAQFAQKNDVTSRNGLVSVANSLNKGGDVDVGALLNAVKNEVKGEKRKSNAEVANILKNIAQETLQDRLTESECDSDDEIMAAVKILARGTSDGRKRKVKRSVDYEVLKARSRKGLDKNTSIKGLHRRRLSRSKTKILSRVQRRLLESTLFSDNNHIFSLDDQMKGTDSLAQPKKSTKSSKKFAKLDDAKNCRFYPKIRNNPNGEVKQDDENPSNNKTLDFVRKMEYAERRRLEDIRFSREEKEYNARLDKKECPSCGNSQSYAEVSQKRKKCPSCGVEYRPKLAWGDVGDAFFERVEANKLKKIEGLEESKNREKLSFRIAKKKIYDAEAKTVKTVNIEEKYWDEVEDEFMERLRICNERKNQRSRKLKDAEIKKFQYSPQISSFAKRLQLGPFCDRMDQDINMRNERFEQYKALKSEE